MSKESRHSAEKSTNNNCLFVGGLNPKVDRKQIRNHFSKYGKITNLFQKIDSVTKYNKGYTFVYFSDEKTLEKVQKEAQFICDRQVECKKNHGREYNNQDLGQTLKCKLYVGNLDPEFTNENLNAHFSIYGQIKHAYLIFDNEKQVSKCFGYVHYETEKSAQRAIDTENSNPNNSIIVQKFDPKFKTEKKSVVEKVKTDIHRSKNTYSKELVKKNYNKGDISETYTRSDSEEYLNSEQIPSLTGFINKQNELNHLLKKMAIHGNKDAILTNHASLRNNSGRQQVLPPNKPDLRHVGMNKPNLRYNDENKRWSDYIVALNKNKERFQLFNKKDGSYPGSKTECFDNYVQSLKNQNENKNSESYQMSQSTNDSKAYDPKQLDYQNNILRRKQRLALQNQQQNFPQNHSYENNFYFEQSQFCQQGTENQYYYMNQYYGSDNSDCFQPNYHNESNYMNARNSHCQQMYNENPAYTMQNNQGIYNPNSAFTMQNNQGMHNSNSAYTMQNNQGMHNSNSAYTMQNNQGMHNSNSGFTMQDNQSMHNPNSAFTMQDNQGMYCNQEHNNNPFYIDEQGRITDPNQNSYM